MDIRRKLQLGAAAVIANGLIALTVMAPKIAVANPCAEIVRAGPIGGCGNATLMCQSFALPGCTVTSATCTILVNRPLYDCHYD